MRIWLILMVLPFMLRCVTHPDCIDESKKDPSIMCPANIALVCGCDGNTYGNSCEAGRAGVTSWTEGACR